MIKEGEERFEKNLKIMDRFSFHYVDKIRNPPTHQLEICSTKKKELNLKTIHYPETFHSEDGALDEAEKWFESLQNTNDIDTLIVFGLGLGYSFFAARKWLEESEDRFLVFLEDNFEVIHHFFQLEVGSEIYSHPQVVIVPFQTPNENEMQFFAGRF